MSDAEDQAYKRGKQDADIQSLHYRLNEIKDLLQQQSQQHSEEIARLDAKFEERVRPLEKFRAGVVYIGTGVATVATFVAGLFTFKIGGGNP